MALTIIGRFQKFVSNDIGIDLGTANTLVHLRGQGIVLNEPSIVSINKDTRKVLAVGIEAKRMLGRTPGSIETIRPLRQGVITDLEIAEEMLRYFIQKVHHRIKIFQPRILIAVPSGITEVETKAVKDSADRAGARDIKLIPQPMASALGADLPVSEPIGSMIVDIGGGTTEVAIISLNGIVRSNSVRTAGDSMDGAIEKYVYEQYNLLIGPRMSEDIKIQIGSTYPMDEEKSMQIKGRDERTNIPKTISINSVEIREALQKPLAEIVEAIKTVFKECPPELSGDLIDRGISIAGGGALLKGIDKTLSEETSLPVTIVPEPLHSVARGTGIALDRGYLD